MKRKTAAQRNIHIHGYESDCMSILKDLHLTVSRIKLRPAKQAIPKAKIATPLIATITVRDESALPAFFDGSGSGSGSTSGAGTSIGAGVGT